MNSIFFLRQVGTALIILALVGPIAYCTMQTENRAKLVKACMEAKGDWTNGYGGHCTQPLPTIAEKDKPR